MKKVIRTRVGTSSRALKRSQRSRTRKSATSVTIRVEFASRFSDYSESPMEATARGRSTVLPFYRGSRASSPRPDRSRKEAGRDRNLRILPVHLAGRIRRAASSKRLLRVSRAYDREFLLLAMKEPIFRPTPHIPCAHPRPLSSLRQPRRGTWGFAIYLHEDTRGRAYVRAHALVPLIL